MAEIIKSKTLNTILRLKYDTLANWKAAEEYVPMKGEVCIVSVPANTQQVASEPAILFKVGDGTGVVFKKEGSSKTELPWASGLAADVYAWAKNPTKPDYNATEISVVDTEGKFTSVTDKTVEEVLKALKTEIDAMGGDAGSISTQINNAINGLGSVTVTDGNYVTGVKVENGKLVLTETPLPDYSNTYAAKSLETTVSTLRGEFDAHITAVSGYDQRITDAQTTADKGVADAAAAHARADEAYELANTKTTMAEVEVALDKKVDKVEGYSLVSDTEIARLATIDNYNDTEVRGLISGNTNAIAAIKDGTTIDSFKDVEDTLANTYATKTEAQGYANAKDEAIAAAKKAGDDAQADVDILIGSDTGKSVRAIANEELAAQLIPETAVESLDTLQEIAAWIQSHPENASAMNAAIEALQTKLTLGTYLDGEVPKEYATVKAYVEAAIAALNIGNYALAADLTALAGRVTTNENAITDITKEGGLIATAKAEAISAAAADAETKASTAESNAKTYTDTEIGKVNTEVAKKANDADLKAIAKTGNVNDLVQTSGEVLILFGGNAAGWTE